MKDVAERIRGLSPQQREQLKQRLQGKQSNKRLAPNPVGVVGLACRFPGGADSLDDFWRLLDEGRDAVSEAPAERWPAESLYDPDPHRAGFMNSRWGAFLDNIDRFDAQAFGISPREAATMDPQHRLLLETTWQALADAGLRRDALKASKTGVFVAVYQRDFLREAVADRFAIDAYTASGTHHSIAANRLSYLLDLRGPSLVVDTACSSSLTALHLACRSLLSGECDRAIVGAANLMLSPEETISLSRWGMLAADGRCKTFDAGADGFVRGEGCAVVVLERLQNSPRDASDFHAVICGTAVNQDGRSNGLTAPNGQAQQAVLRAALLDAGVEAQAIGYVEAHGTGTSLGDPIEVEALAAVMGAPRENGERLWLGSVKSNIGHTEACAGLAGFVKAVLALERERIPKTLHFEELNPAIALQGTALAVAAEARDWPRAEAPRFAGVSSFGMGGTNAHVLLSEAPKVAAGLAVEKQGEGAGSQETSGFLGPVLLPLSAHSEAALQGLLEAWRGFAGAKAEDFPEGRIGLVEAARAVALRRFAEEQRVAVLAENWADLRGHLQEYAREGDAAWVRGGLGRPTVQGPVFVLPGQGAQWRGMGLRWMAAEPAFREQMEACDAVIGQLAGWSVIDKLRAAETAEDFDRIGTVQPLIFSVQTALAALWRSYGVEPGAVIGHSMGEAAAAWIAGALSLEDAAKVIVRRTLLMARLGGRGAMAQVELSEQEARKRLEKSEQTSGPAGEALVAVAVVNGPRQTVLSGDAAALESLVEELEAEGVLCRAIRVDVASHSPQVDPLKDELLAALADLQPRRPEIPILSTVGGTSGGVHEHGAPNDEPWMDAAYWYRNLREPVRFWRAAQRAWDQGHRRYVELSTHPILLASLRDGFALDGREPLLAASGRRQADELRELRMSLGALWADGVDVRWERLYPGPSRRVSLPPVAFARQSFPWRRAANRQENSGSLRRGPLLGQRIDRADMEGATLWNLRLGMADLPWLRDHAVEGVCVLPGTGVMELVLEAAADLGRDGAPLLEGLVFERPVFLPEDGEVELQLALESGGEWRLFGRTPEGTESASGSWELHARGRLRWEALGGEEWVAGQALVGGDEKPSARAANFGERRSGADFYRRLAASGNTWGASFQGVKTVAKAGGELLVEMALPANVRDELGRYQAHPVVLDVAGQALSEGLDGAAPGPFFLRSLARLRVLGDLRGARWSRLTVLEADSERMSGDVCLLDDEGRLLAVMEGLCIRFLAQGARSSAQVNWLHRVLWRASKAADDARKRGALGAPAALGRSGDSRNVAMAMEGVVSRNVVLVGASAGLAERLRSLVEAAGGELVAVADARELAEQQGRIAALRAGGKPQELLFVGWDRNLALDALLWDAARSAQEHTIAADSGRLWFVTRGAATWKDPDWTTWPCDSTQSALWGLGSSLDVELGDGFGGLVDLDPKADDAALVQQIWGELQGATEDGRRICWRDGKRFVARLEAWDATELGAGRLSLDPAGTYLVTGGLGELGLLAAERLLRRGAHRLVLLGRSELPPRTDWGALEPGTEMARKVAGIGRLEALGAAVDVAAVDVSDPGNMDGFAAWLRAERPALRGIVHAAGVQSPAALGDMDLGDLRRELAAKARGALLLWEHFGASVDGVEGLEWMVLFSSGASVLGSPLLGGYAAANAFLDGFAAWARAQAGPRVLSLNWGAWATEGGMGARYEAGSDRRLDESGLVAMEPERALDWMERLLAAAGSRELSQAVVMPVDWAAWGERYGADAAPFLRELLQGAERVEVAQSQETSVKERLGVAESQEERRELLEGLLRKRIARVLRVAPEALDMGRPLTRMGLDSLMAVELRNALARELDSAPSIVEILRCSGGDALVERLLDLVGPEDVAEDEWEELVL